MLVKANGDRLGVISSGCIEAAITEQALAALTLGEARLLRYGIGSPWIDLQLPCGAGIDVHIAVDHNMPLVESTLEQLSKRQAVSWTLEPQSLKWLAQDEQTSANWTELQYTPQRQLMIAGRGPALASLAAIAYQCEIAVDCYSPEAEDLSAAKPFSRNAYQLAHPGDFSCPSLDRWSGAVLLFHDHDWEPKILSALLNTEAAYISALGSPTSHAARCELLLEFGIKQQQIQRIKGPAGLDIGARSPAEIALSIVAEYVAALSAAEASANLENLSYLTQPVAVAAR